MIISIYIFKKESLNWLQGKLKIIQMRFFFFLELLYGLFEEEFGFGFGFELEGGLFKA